MTIQIILTMSRRKWPLIFFVHKFSLLAYLLFFLLFFARPCSGFAQKQKDTAFLFREIVDGNYRAVYIDANNSPAYDNIIKYISIDTFRYNRVMQQLKDSGIATNHIETNFPSEWYSLYMYKNKNYVYSPSEPYANLYMQISDSAFVLNYFNDGCIPALLQKVSWTDEKTLEIHTNGLYKEDTLIVFHFLTKEKDIAVVEFPLTISGHRFHLLVAKKSLHKFPVIVNLCPGYRCIEWEFDKINDDYLRR